MTFETYTQLPKSDFAGYEKLEWPTSLNPHEYPYHIDHEYIVLGRHCEQYRLYLVSLNGHQHHIIVKFKGPDKQTRRKPLHGPDDKILFEIDNDKYELHIELK